MSSKPREAHESDSLEQRDAEPEILRSLAAELGVELRPKQMFLPGGARVDVDGVAGDDSILVEVFAHQGRLKGGQFHKVARDTLKLITLSRSRPQSRLILAFGDAEAARAVTGKSWLAEALRTWHVETYVAPLSEAIRETLRAAQVRQVMVNPGPMASELADGSDAFLREGSVEVVGGGTRRIGLVGCVKQKASSVRPAKDLYLSTLFTGRRAFVEASCDEWWILSAEHGLLAPGALTEPYDKSLKQATTTERRQWSSEVLRAIDAQIGDLHGMVVEIHAGAEYRAFGLEEGLVARGCMIEVPTAGMPIGRQLQFYAKARP